MRQIPDATLCASEPAIIDANTFQLAKVRRELPQLFPEGFCRDDQGSRIPTPQDRNHVFRRSRRGRHGGRSAYRRLSDQPGQRAQIDGKVIPPGLVDGNPVQIPNLAIAVPIAAGLSAVGTFVILKICDAPIGVRVENARSRKKDST
jgi:hypothetical protein